MKKFIILMLGLLLIGLLVACSATSTTTEAQATTTSGGNAAPNGTPGPGNFQVSTLTRLLIGTLKLETTDQAVSAEQAQTLLPLWQAIQSLSQSDTTADAEMAALEQQIQDTYTAEQLSAITALAIAPEDMQTLMQELGLSFGNFGDGTPQPGGGGGGFPGGGDFPPPGGGGAGGDGAGGFNPQDLSPEQQATLEARRASGEGRPGAGVPAPLLNALIELLEGRAG